MDDRPYTDCFNNYSLLVDNRRSGAMLQIWTWLQVNIQHLRNSWCNRSIEKKPNLLLNNDLAKIHPLINIQFFEDNRHVFFGRMWLFRFVQYQCRAVMFLRLTIPGKFFSQSSAGSILTTTQYFFFYRLKFIIMKITTRCLLF